MIKKLEQIKPSNMNVLLANVQKINNINSDLLIRYDVNKLKKIADEIFNNKTGIKNEDGYERAYNIIKHGLNRRKKLYLNKP